MFAFKLRVYSILIILLKFHEKFTKIILLLLGLAGDFHRKGQKSKNFVSLTFSGVF